MYGDDYPRDATPFSFVTVPELRWLATSLHLSDGDRFVDLACGRGGPGLWVARATGAALIGIDSSVAAILAAARLTRQSDGAPLFVVADAAASGLRADSVEAVMSVDALQLIPHRNAVLGEVARVLKPGGRFAFTTWLSRSGRATVPFPVDYRPLLSAVGLSFEACHEPPDWQPRESAVFAGIRLTAASLRAECGEEVAGMLVAEAERMPEVLPLIWRVNVRATKPANRAPQPASGAQVERE